MNRVVTLTVLAVLILPLAPTVQAAWTTSVTVPTSFRPDRDVTFTYTSASSSGLDARLAWRITLYTCQDVDGDAWCEVTDARRVDHGDRTINIVGGQSSSVSWTVNLPHPEGNYWYQFHTACLNNPCTGSVPPGGAHNRTGAFQLAYTDTWARELIATSPTSQGTTQAVTYRIVSTSLDDADLRGSATLRSRPPQGEALELDPNTYVAPANSVTDVVWTGVAFPDAGTHRLAVGDTNAPDSFLDVAVHGVHLHAVQPRPLYAEGAMFGLYFVLEGHDGGASATPVEDDIEVAIANGTFPLLAATVRSGIDGRAYIGFQPPADVTGLTWYAMARGSWGVAAYDVDATGEIAFVAQQGDERIASDVSSIRDNLSDLKLRGVHLDEIGSRNAWMTSLRATGAVVIVVLLIILVVFIALRV